MKARERNRRSALGAICMVCLLLGAGNWSRKVEAQTPPIKDIRADGIKMLAQVKDDLKGYYYDRNFRGMNLDTRFAAAKQKIEQATTAGQVWGIIEQVLLDLGDSHTFFIPPGWTVRVDYGFTVQMIGDRCLVTSVEHGSDAESKGLKPGDEIYSIDGVGVSRDNYEQFYLLYYILRPKTGMKLAIQRTDGSQPEFEIKSKTEKSKEPASTFELQMHYMFPVGDKEKPFKDLGGGVFLWRMKRFGFPGEVDAMMKDIRKYDCLILDLRGNPGGYLTTLQEFLGYMFEHDVIIGVAHRRSGDAGFLANGKGDHRFKGKLVVLIDSRSASSAELFAKVVQLERRGIIVGDRSGGNVMGARRFQHQIGTIEFLPYIDSITVEDIAMSDGKSLEHRGVIPDEIVLPTPADLAAKRDPALSRAAELVGLKLDPQKAAAIFKAQ
jgi:C-terminal processing protease CtpA/Prc